MFFIFGWGHRKVKREGSITLARCPNCHNEAWFELLSYRTWLTLFFIPVLPYESGSLLVCPVCSCGPMLTKEQVVRIREFADARQSGLMSADACHSAIGALGLLPAPAVAMPAGWHPDPSGRNHHRFWDGSVWTEQVANDGVAGEDPLT